MAYHLFLSVLRYFLIYLRVGNKLKHKQKERQEDEEGEEKAKVEWNSFTASSPFLQVPSIPQLVLPSYVLTSLLH